MSVNQSGDLPEVRGTQVLIQDTPEVYRQKLAGITLDSMVRSGRYPADGI